MRNLPARFLLALAAAFAAAPASAQSPSTHHHSFSGAEHWAGVFDDPKRDAWQKPHEVIQALKLAPGATVADIGAGTGYFSARLSHMLPKGRVYAVDVEPDMVKYLAARAKKEKLNNLTAVAGTPTDPRLPGKVDLVLLVDVFHHIDDRPGYFRGLRASLKPGGRVAIIDFRLDSPEVQPVYDPVSQLVYAAGREHASHVWVAGKPAVIDGKLQNPAFSGLESRAKLWHNRLSTRSEH